MIAVRDEQGRIPAVEHIDRPCDHCAKPMRLAPWEARRRGGNKFCSKDCCYAGRQVTKTFQVGHADFRSPESRPHKPETRAKIAKVQREKNIRGREHWNWQGGSIQPERRKLMRQWEYREWRTAVFERDSYTCQACGARGHLNADHIKRWKEHPELRYDVNNGRTLCAPCHRTTPTWGRRSQLNMMEA